MFCDGQQVAGHDRSWARHGVVTDPVHVATAHQMRLALAEQRRAQQRAQQRAEQGGARRHSDGHAVALRALPDYDALFGVDFTPTDPTAAATAEASTHDGDNDSTRGLSDDSISGNPACGGAAVDAVSS